jgi:hypothetical protein
VREGIQPRAMRALDALVARGWTPFQLLLVAMLVCGGHCVTYLH